jgi:DNA-binding response OmpR family regulator
MDKTKSCRILAISDFDWRSSIRNRLDLGGYTEDELRFADSGLEGLASAEQDPPDLIIYGLCTLDLDGYEFCRRLKWIPALSDVPVLLVGWLAPRVVYPRAKRAEAAGYLHRTVHAQGLVVARNALLRGETYYPSDPGELEPVGDGDEEGRRVLVIDDNAAMGELAQMILGQERNDEVRYANSGPKGLNAARQNPPDLIILDVMMPGWDGFETFRQLRMASELEAVPILFQTAYARAYQTIQSLEASGCLLAPYGSQELVAARDAVLAGRTYYPNAERN